MTDYSREAKTTMLPVLYAGAFVAAFNSSVVNVAVPAIMAEMGVDAAATAWLVSGYMMVQAVMMSLYAFLSKRFDTRTLFLAAAGVFVVGELGAVLAPAFPALLVFRVIQAVGGAMFIPTMMAAVLMLSSREKVASNLAIGNAVIGAAPAFAPMVCGALIGAFGWRSAFALPLVLMVLVAIAGFALVKPLAPAQEASVDMPSVVLVSATLVAFIYGVSQLAGNLVLGLAMLTVSVVTGFLFARRQNGLEQPLLSMEPLRTPTFAACCLLLILAIMQNFSMSLLLPTYYQSVLGVNPAQSGLLLFVPAVIMAVIIVVSGKLMDRYGAWPLISVGFLGLVLGQVLVRTFGASQQLELLVASSVLVFACAGVVQSPIQSTALGALDPSLNAAGVSFVNICIQSGSAIGPALFTGILSSTVASSVAAGASMVDANAAGFVLAVTCAAVLALVGLVASVPVTRNAAK